MTLNFVVEFHIIASNNHEEKRLRLQEIEYLIRLWRRLRCNLKHSKVKCKSPKASIRRFSCKEVSLEMGNFYDNSNYC
jgi:hypothetical protein